MKRTTYNKRVSIHTRKRWKEYENFLVKKHKNKTRAEVKAHLHIKKHVWSIPPVDLFYVTNMPIGDDLKGYVFSEPSASVKDVDGNS